jgi:hypothetical protein
MRNFLFRAVPLAAALCLAGLGIASSANASTALARPNATSVCSFGCFNLSSEQLGLHMIQNKSNTKASKINLRIASNVFTNEDFTDDAIGSVSDYCSTTPNAQQFNNSSYICQHLSGDTVYEADWSPNSNESGECVGVAASNVAGQNVTLQACGQTTRTLWIADAAHGTFHHGHFYTPWINGSDTQFSHPLGLAVSLSSKSPADQLVLQRENLSAGKLPLTQEFTVEFGPAA